MTARALHVRREHPEAFVGESTTYEGLETTSGHALAFVRGDDAGPRAVTVVTRAAGILAAAGGFGDATVAVPAGTWRDVLSERDVASDGSGVRLADLLADRPVALLVAS